MNQTVLVKITILLINTKVVTHWPVRAGRRVVVGERLALVEEAEEEHLASTVCVTYVYIYIYIHIHICIHTYIHAYI